MENSNANNPQRLSFWFTLWRNVLFIRPRYIFFLASKEDLYTAAISSLAFCSSICFIFRDPDTPWNWRSAHHLNCSSTIVVINTFMVLHRWPSTGNLRLPNLHLFCFFLFYFIMFSFSFHSFLKPRETNANCKTRKENTPQHQRERKREGERVTREFIANQISRGRTLFAEESFGEEN